jgi:hypothetical protein
MKTEVRNMDDIRMPDALIPKNVKSPAAFIADKRPELPDYGIASGDLVIIDREAEFAEGELSVFQSKKDDGFRLSKEKIRGYKHFGKVVMAVKYYGDSPFSEKE